MAISIEDSIARRSIEVLKDGQSPTGAFVASPTFPTYRFAWLRDGAFCAHALDVVGEHDRAAAFHRWVARSVAANTSLFEAAIAGIERGDPPPPEAMPPARYMLDGTLEPSGPEPWPNFQFDGYGMWLWALAEHLDGRDATAYRDVVRLVARYLVAARTVDSFSCWEEADDGEHASALGAAIAGLEAASVLLDDGAWTAEAARGRSVLCERFVRGGRFTRGPVDDRVDGSLIWLGVPFGAVPLEDARLERTIDAVRRDLLRPGGGVYRYRGDTYYGGGEWILLACSLAWHELRTGDHAAADALRTWVRAQAGDDGALPEQVTTHAQVPEMVAPWIARWGSVASPLLWSHAMYLIVEAEAGA